MVVVQTGTLAGSAESEKLWRHCRNSIRIARLLSHNGCSGQLVETACEMAMECACRALLQAHDARYESGLVAGLTRLSAPRELLDRVSGEGDFLEKLDLAEIVIAWVAARLRERYPDRSWGY